MKVYYNDKNGEFIAVDGQVAYRFFIRDAIDPLAAAKVWCTAETNRDLIKASLCKLISPKPTSPGNLTKDQKELY